MEQFDSSEEETNVVIINITDDDDSDDIGHIVIVNLMSLVIKTVFIVTMSTQECDCVFRT